MKDTANMYENDPTVNLDSPSTTEAQETTSLQEAGNPPDTVEDCWNLIGSFGDGSCMELAEAILCRNCRLFSTAGRNLLEREPPEGYVEDWTELLGRRKAFQGATTTGAIIFRLGLEWLALPAGVFKQVAQIRTIHSLPHRSGPILKGLANVLGALRLCISLHDLLGVEKATDSDQRPERKTYARLAVIEKEGDCWVFPVDEVYGMYRLHPDELQSVPVTVARSAVSYTKGLFHCGDKIVGFLDDTLLFYSLKRRIL